MDPLLIEVHCTLGQSDPQWESITTLPLEIGYPGRNGQTLWKHIGWLKNHISTTGRDFVQALWNHDVTDRVLVFDFLPVLRTGNQKTETAYRLRKTLLTANGRQQTSTRLLRGNYQDEHFTLVTNFTETE
ncbi:MAG: hypothetical protein ABIQ93_04865 [Saprospiraceae bacterium]